MTAFLVVLGVIFWLIAAPWQGWVVMKLWLWFAVPLGAPPIVLWQAIGLSLLAHLLTHRESGCQEKKDAWASQVASCFVFPAIGLLLGWLTLMVFK